MDSTAYFFYCACPAHALEEYGPSKPNAPRPFFLESRGAHTKAYDASYVTDPGKSLKCNISTKSVT